ncbi:hypothetical protein [Mycobacterium sp. DL592]|uniref:hypothetical protein n=1 Tax=Mycobacterium sp. DL592 TaxID=2675524 RepID=UPI0014215216|nr:hypothetical protein [Mycobacterium sp. DL592]
MCARNPSAQYAPAFGGDVVAYGLVTVTVVVGVGVGEFSGGGVNSPAVSTGGGGGGPTVGFNSVVEIGRVVVVVVGVLEVVVDVVRVTDDCVAGLSRCRELCAVWITANSKISNNSPAAIPET